MQSPTSLQYMFEKPFTRVSTSSSWIIIPTLVPSPCRLAQPNADGTKVQSQWFLSEEREEKICSQQNLSFVLQTGFQPYILAVHMHNSKYWPACDTLLKHRRWTCLSGIVECFPVTEVLGRTTNNKEGR